MQTRSHPNVALTGRGLAGASGITGAAGGKAPPTRAALIFLLSVLLICNSRAWEPEQTAPGQLCPHSDVRVFAADARDFRDGCAGARSALTFLAPQKTSQTDTLVIHVRANLLTTAGPTAQGAFFKQCNCSMFVTYASFRKQKTWFKVPVNRDLYRSLATHEAAHAVAARMFQIPSPTIQAKEYVAYVTMFATMDPLLRERTLRALPGSGFESEDRINLIAYMFDPMRFGAEAYRHYMKPGNGDAFLQFVLQGKALTTD